MGSGLKNFQKHEATLILVSPTAFKKIMETLSRSVCSEVHSCQRIIVPSAKVYLISYVG